MTTPPKVGIRDDHIKLGQFLKLANLVESGGMAKELLAEGLVTVNGEVDTRRGRSVSVGDIVAVDGVAAEVATLDEAAAAIDW